MNCLPIKRAFATFYDLKQNVAYDFIPYNDEIEKDKFNAIAFGSLALRGEYNESTLKKILSAGSFKKVFCDLNLRPPFIPIKAWSFA